MTPKMQLLIGHLRAALGLMDEIWREGQDTGVIGVDSGNVGWLAGSLGGIIGQLDPDGPPPVFQLAPAFKESRPWVAPVLTVLAERPPACAPQSAEASPESSAAPSS